MKYDDAFEVLIGHEGGFTLDRRDRGNWTSGEIGKGQLKGTKFGISAMSYPDVDIEHLSLDQAKMIYRRDYWDRVKCEQLPEALRFDMFDCAVNSGTGNAIKFLQKALGVTADGIIGPKTLEAAKAIDPHLLDKRFSGHRLDFINSLSTFPTYGKGWTQRIADNLIRD